MLPLADLDQAHGSLLAKLNRLPLTAHPCSLVVDRRALQMEEIQIESFRDHPPDPAAWDECVASARSMHLEQTSAWAEARRLDGWAPTYLLARQESRLVGGALLLVRRIKGYIAVGYVSRGPILRAELGEREEDVATEIAKGLVRVARANRLTVLIVDPPYFAGVLPAALKKAGCVPHLPQLPPTGLMKGTLLIDLRASEEELLRGLRRSTRQLLRKADQEPALRFREGGAQDIDTLWKLMNELCRRRGVRPNVSSPAVMRALWDRLSPTKSVRIDVLEFNGEPLTAVMTVCVGRWAIPWRIGWSGTEAKLSPEKILYWNLIRALKNAGYTTFDFNWIDPTEADAIRAGVASLDPTAHTGITAFKIGFGGDIVRIEPPMDYFPSSIVRSAMRLGLGKIVSSKTARKILNRANRPT